MSTMTNYKLVFVLIVVVVSQVFNYASALNILAIASLPFKSHYMAFQTLFRELAIRGHSVTVINNFPENNPVPNLKFININAPIHPTPGMAFFENYTSSFSHLLNFKIHFTIGPPNVKQDCELFFSNKDVEALRERGDKFDVIFVEQFVSDCGLAYAAALYDAPIIGITSHTLLPWAYSRIGMPFDISSNAFYFSNSGTNPSVYQKVENYLMNIYANTIGLWQLHRSIYDIFNKNLPNVALDVEKIARDRMKMMFAYQHYSITGARLLAPQLLEIAGMHIGKPQPVPEDIEKFISSAKDGVVYVSFGSNLKASTMSKKKIEQFLLAFKKIPQKVLWKLEDTTFLVSNDNLLTRSWFPQLDVLCHPNVIAFVSHGGMLSISEAAHCGTPLLTIPFFGDQFSNSAAVADSGLGMTMYFDHLNDDNLAEAIKQLASSEVQQNAKQISKLWHDRPMNVLDSAIFWTEYVARHKTAPPSLPSTHNSCFISSLLDVYSILIVFVLGILSLVYIICKILILVFTSFVKLFKSENKQKTKKKRS
ncbi:UDP-glucosyltransferase 2-like [Vanessa tameamea]|uniref:UDP-glucuronosyltransferase n=1 Tax=Vanessa tameamea TaxID=334116 RepID=A0A8B8IYW8_VANTA